MRPGRPFGCPVVCLLILGWVAGCGGPRPQKERPAPDQAADLSTRRPDRSSPLSLTDQAARAFDRGDLQASAGLVQNALLERPNHLPALWLAARIEARAGRTDTAVSLLLEAAEKHPDESGPLWSEAAMILDRSGDPVGALRQYQQVLKVHPRHVETLRAVASLCGRLGFRFDGNEALRRLCRQTPMQLAELYDLLDPACDPLVLPENVDATVSLVPVLRQVRQNMLSEALQSLRRSPLVREEHPVAMSMLGRLLTQVEDVEQVDRWFAKRKPAWKRYPDYWIAIGNRLTSAGRHGDAVLAFAAAVQREPCHRGALQRLAQSLEADGRRQQALRVSQRARLIKDLRETARDAYDTPRATTQPYVILDRELRNIGLPFQAFGWQFNAIALFQPQQASFNNHALGVQQIVASIDADDVASQQRVHLPAASTAQLESLRWESARTAGNTAGSPSFPPTDAIPDFRDVASDVGLRFQYRNADPIVERGFLLHQGLGAGIACLDFDRDGNTDLYAAQGGCNPPQADSDHPNMLARNLGDRFSVVTSAAGADDRAYSMGVTSGDWNQDGLSDLVIGNMSRNTLLVNQGDGTFASVDLDGPWQEGVYTSGLAVADLTGDRLPEIIEINYVHDDRIFDPIEYRDGKPVRLPGPLQFTPAADRVFVAQGDGSLRAVTLPSSRHVSTPRPAMGLIVGDLDMRPGNEWFVANDQTANSLWVLDQKTGGDVQFVDHAAVKGIALGVAGLPLASMGVAVADFDRNGLPDLHITNFDDELSNHFLQRAGGVFEDRVTAVGLERHSRGVLGFGAQAIDFDNNGVPDLCVGNGHIEDLRPSSPSFKMPTQFFVSEGPRFRLVEFPSDNRYWNQDHLTRAMVRLDWNRDGRVDLAVGDLMEPLVLLENRTEGSGNWLQLDLAGVDCERDAIGATVELKLAEESAFHFVVTGDGYMCRNQSTLFCGLGDAERVDRLTIRWPGRDEADARIAGCRATFAAGPGTRPVGGRTVTDIRRTGAGPTGRREP